MGERASFLPWQHPDFRGWFIVGMNHYAQNGERNLFVAMTRKDGFCIQAEGPDRPALWEGLRLKARWLDNPRETAGDIANGRDG